jgi:hypothetical protein
LSVRVILCSSRPARLVCSVGHVFPLQRSWVLRPRARRQGRRPEHFYKPKRQIFQSPAFGMHCPQNARRSSQTRGVPVRLPANIVLDTCRSNLAFGFAHRSSSKFASGRLLSRECCHASETGTGSAHHRTGSNGQVAYGKWPGGIFQHSFQYATVSVVSAPDTSWRCKKGKPLAKRGRKTTDLSRS